jgi:hypothetical protein
MAIKIKRSSGLVAPNSLDEGQLGYSYPLSGLYVGDKDEKPILIGGQKLVSGISGDLNNKVDKFPSHANDLAVLTDDGNIQNISKSDSSIGPIGSITVNGDAVTPTNRIVNIEIDSEEIKRLTAWSGVINTWSGSVNSDIEEISGKLSGYVTSVLIGGTDVGVTSSSWIPAYISGTFDTEKQDNTSTGLAVTINAIPTSAVEDEISSSSTNYDIPSSKAVVDYVNNKITSAVIYKGTISTPVAPSGAAAINAAIMAGIDDSGYIPASGDYWELVDWRFNGHTGPARAIYNDEGEGSWSVIGDNAREAGKGLELEGNKLNVQISGSTNLYLEPTSGLYVSGLIKNIIGTGVTRDGDTVTIPDPVSYSAGSGISIVGSEISNKGVLNASIYGNATRVSGEITIPAPSIQYNPVTSGSNPNVEKTAGVGGLILLEDIDDGTW